LSADFNTESGIHPNVCFFFNFVYLSWAESMAESHFTSDVYAMYAIGSLDGDDLSEFSRHIGQGCDACHGELVQARELWTSFAAATPPVAPRPEVKQRILAAARQSSVVTMRPARTTRIGWWQQAAAAIVILGIGVGVGWNLRRPAAPAQVVQVAPPAPIAPAVDQRAEQENRELRARIAELDKTLAAQQAQLRDTGARSTELSNLQAALTRAQAEASANAQGLRQAETRATQLEAQGRQLQTQATTAEARARDAEQRYQTADSERKEAVDREARQRETTAARIRQLEGENEKFRRVIDDQQRRIQQNTQLVAFFQSPDLKFYRFQGTKDGPSAKAHVVMQAGSKAMFYAFNLPQLPAGRTYQLWVIRGQSPAIVSGGIFRADSAGNAVVEFSDAAMLKDVRQFAVTDEPAGGSRGPTGKQFFRPS
jgi:anti-sigma-K factor RskA